MADVQVVPPPPVDEYVSDLTVGSGSEAPVASRRAPSKVATPRRTRHTTGKIAASQAVAQVAEAKKKRGKRTRSEVSVDTTTISFDVEVTVKMTRVMCSRQRQQRLRRREGRRQRHPARCQGRMGDLHRAPTQRTTLGRTRD
jgi:hypothetical protein